VLVPSNVKTEVTAMKRLTIAWVATILMVSASYGGAAARGPYGGTAYRGPVYGGTVYRGTTVVTPGVGYGVAAGVAVGAAAGAAAASSYYYPPYCSSPPYCYPAPYYQPPAW
jgi:hypothetical protein